MSDCTSVQKRKCGVAHGWACLAVRKQRRLRSWRHPDLDDRLGRRRMIAEARLMVRLYRSGLNIPVLYDCDIKEQQLVMSNIPGRPLIELLNDDSIDDQRIREHLLAAGRSIRLLHRQAIVHGDLSTNNIMMTPDGDAVLIDFGLAKIEFETELYGIDLHVLFEILGASHPHREGAMEAILEGYAQCERNWELPLQRLVATCFDGRCSRTI